jgi:hypothetical protein
LFLYVNTTVDLTVYFLLSAVLAKRTAKDKAAALALTDDYKLDEVGLKASIFFCIVWILVNVPQVVSMTFIVTSCSLFFLFA